MRIQKHRKDNISSFLVNIATAWFVTGIITPMFTHQPFSVIMLLDLMIGTSLSYWSLRSSWELYK